MCSVKLYQDMGTFQKAAEKVRGAEEEQPAGSRQRRKTFQELEFQDSFMFAAAMSDPETCRIVLERILDISILKVVVHAEHTLLVNPDFRGVRLDVYADDEAGTVYDVEMQTTDKRNLPKRSRFYQSQMDAASLEPGDDFNKLLWIIRRAVLWQKSLISRML